MGEQLSLDNPVCFEEVFRKYYPSLLAFVVRHVGDREVAKDFVQDVFFKLYEHRTEFSSDISLKSWLYKTSRNVALDYLRHLKIVDEHQLLMAESMLFAAEVDEILSEELVRKINESINSLPSQCQQIIRLNVLEGRKYTEIAEELGVSINTVKTQISRGYKKLRDILSDHFNPLVLLYLQFNLLAVEHK